MPSVFQTLKSPRHVIILLQGFSSGLPLLLIGGTLRAWMKDSGVDLTLIGLFAFVGLPYSFKFVWAPIIDRFAFPIFGRRRGWMLLFQVGLILSLMGMAAIDPVTHPFQMALMAFVTAFFSASQDIVIDAYRREVLPDTELGLGSSMTQTGYRLGLLCAGSLALILADQIPWSAVYLCMAGLVFVGVFATLFCPEPILESPLPRNFKEAVIDPFVDYFKRTDAIWILGFILLYKIGDSMASDMLNPFYLDIGFTKTQIGLISKPIGIWATIAGSIVGGILLIRLSMKSALFSFGILQALTTLFLAALALTGPNPWALGGIVFFETFASGMGSAAYAAFMMKLTNKKFTGTQYALLTSFMGLPRTFFGASTGYLAKTFGWEGFFLLCTLMALPALWMVSKRYSKWV